QGTVIPAGTTFGNRVALKRIGLVNYSWFAGRYGRIINGLHVSARTLPILLTHDVMLDFKTPAACCVGGIHSATSSPNGNGNRQDGAFLSWFAHQTPSIGIRDRYTYLGTLTSPSPLC